jgi:hypothetical protein
LLTDVPTGEKRKRKLRYLQQLIQDGSNNGRTPDAAHQQEDHLLPPSIEYERRALSSSPFTPPTASRTLSLSPISAPITESHRTVSSVVAIDQLPTTTEMYPSFDTSWTNSQYNVPQSVSPSWNYMAPLPTWNHPLHMASQTQTYDYEAPTGPPVFAHTTALYRQSHMLMSNTQPLTIGQSYAPYKDSRIDRSGISSVSLPPSTSPPQEYYSGLH